MDLEIPTFIAEEIYNFRGFSITNAMSGGVLTLTIISLISIVISQAKLIPNTFQSSIEMAYEGLLSFVSQITSDPKITKRIFPIAGALFFYILISNLSTLFPFITSFTTPSGSSIVRTHTTDFNTTFALALGVVLLSQGYSIKEHGLWEYFNKFIKVRSVFNGFREGIGKGVMSLIDFCIGLLDIVSELAKTISLSLRLLGNIFAGEVMAIILFGIFPLLVPVPWIFMNIFSGAVQAIIFTALTAAYLSISIRD